MLHFSPHSYALQKLAEEREKPKYINRRVFQKFLENTGIIAAGTAAGYGAGELTRKGLKKFVPKLPPRGRQAALLAATVAGGAGAQLLKRKMDEEKRRRLEEAYQRGVLEGKRGR